MQTQVFVTHPPIIGRKGYMNFLAVTRRDVNELPDNIGLKPATDFPGDTYYLCQPVPDFWCYIPEGKSEAWARRQIAKRRLAPNVLRLAPDVRLKVDTTRFDKSFESFWKMLGKFRQPAEDISSKKSINELYGKLGLPSLDEVVATKDAEAATAVEGADKLTGDDAWIQFMRDIGMTDQQIAWGTMPTKLRPYQQAFVDSIEPADAVHTILRTLKGKSLTFEEIFKQIAEARKRAKARQAEAVTSVDIETDPTWAAAKAAPTPSAQDVINQKVTDIAMAVNQGFIFGNPLTMTSDDAVDYAKEVGRRVWAEAKKHFESDRIRMFNLLVQDSHNAAVKAGWHSDKNGKPVERNFGEMIALAHSELSEALEADRKNLMDDKLPHRHGTIVELIDLAVRNFDTIGMLIKKMGEADTLPGIVYVEKREFNEQRLDHKLENRFKDGGKAY